MTEHDDDNWTTRVGLDWLWVAIGIVWFAGLGALVGELHARSRYGLAAAALATACLTLVWVLSQ